MLRSYLMIPFIGSQFSLVFPLSSVSEDWPPPPPPLPPKTTEAKFKYFNVIKLLLSRLSLRSSTSRVRWPLKVWLKYVIRFLEYQNLLWLSTSVWQTDTKCSNKNIHVMEESFWGMKFIMFKIVSTKRRSRDVLHITWCDRIISRNEEENNLTKRSVVKICLVGGRLFRYEQDAPKSITSRYDSRD